MRKALARVIIAAIIAATGGHALAAEAGQWDQSTPRAKWFKDLVQPGNGIKCCDVSDCRRTEAEWRNGQWWARVPGGATGEWTAIEPGRVLLNPKSIDGDAYVCSSGPYAAGQSYVPGTGHMVTTPAAPATIYCFVPPTMGF